MGMFESLSHVCITVSDLDKAVSFWRDTLGWKVVMDLKLSGAVMEDFIGVPRLEARSMVLSPAEQPATGMIELIQFSSPSGKPFPSDEKFNDVGLRMISFSVSDIDKVYQELQAKGCKFHTPPQLLEIPGGVASKACIFREPVDGFQIEMVQFLGGAPRAEKQD